MVVGPFLPLSRGDNAFVSDGENTKKSILCYIRSFEKQMCHFKYRPEYVLFSPQKMPIRLFLRLLRSHRKRIVTAKGICIQKKTV